MGYLKKLHVQVLIALAAAVLLGLYSPSTAVAMKPLGQGFIALLRMLLAPIVFCTVISGLAHVSDMRRLGRLGVKTLVYFEVLSTIAMAVGFVMVNLLHPGEGLHAKDLAIDTPVAQMGTAGLGSVSGFFLGLIPSTLLDPFVKGNILQVLLIAIVVGIALNLTGEKSALIVRGIAEGQVVLFKILGFIMRLAPLGAFGAMADAVGSYGGATLLYLLKLVAVYYLSVLLFVVFVLGPVMRIYGLSLWRMLKLIKAELLLVLGTASGEAVFPQLLKKLTHAGCDEVVTSFVLPAGYSFNLDGTGVYMAIAVGFIAQATDTPFSLGQQLAVLAVLMLTSKGGTTVAGGAFVKLAATMESLKVLPLNGLGLLFGVDRLMATVIAMSNVVGNVAAVFIISRMEGVYDAERFEAALAEDGHAPQGARGRESLQG
jgi:aerobic C4-dicarboxylate transport protein